MSPDDSVLVALVNEPRDFEIAVREHWYRIPARHAPKFFSGAQYLAFYFGRAFGDRKWTIQEFAPVRGHELVLRRDLLPDEPEHTRADEHYFKVQIGGLVKREPPIVSKRGRRILFIWTTVQKFMAAIEINDLFHRGKARDKLWESLRRDELDVEREMIVREGRSRYRIDFMIFCPGGRVAVLIDSPARLPRASGKFRVVTFVESQLEERLEQVVEKIRRELEELGQNYVSQEART
jgi:hypothetical protein